MVRSVAPYDLMRTVLARETPPVMLATRAFSASPNRWRRALALEGCAAQFDRALRHSPVASHTPPPLRQELSDATALAVRQALRVPQQVAELADVARECGVRFMVVKGAARLLSGAVPGGRSLSDIDVLARPDDAQRLHATLRRRLGYASMLAAPEHHLPMLSRAGSLPVEVHVQLGPRLTGLDARIWDDAERVGSVGSPVLIPAPTAGLLHALEHGALVHWAVRYRLRDVLDVADAWIAGVDGEEVTRYVRAHPQRVALETLLGAARRFCAAIPAGRKPAWRTVRRVARVRHMVAAYVRSPALAKSLCIAAGVLAEGSPRALLRPTQLALFGVKQARIDPHVTDARSA